MKRAVAVGKIILLILVLLCMTPVVVMCASSRCHPRGRGQPKNGSHVGSRKSKQRMGSLPQQHECRNIDHQSPAGSQYPVNFGKRRRVILNMFEHIQRKDIVDYRVVNATQILKRLMSFVCKECPGSFIGLDTVHLLIRQAQAVAERTDASAEIQRIFRVARVLPYQLPEKAIVFSGFAHNLEVFAARMLMQWRIRIHLTRHDLRLS